MKPSYCNVHSLREDVGAKFARISEEVGPAVL